MALSGTCTLFLNALALYLSVYKEKKGNISTPIAPCDFWNPAIPLVYHL